MDQRTAVSAETPTLGQVGVATRHRPGLRAHLVSLVLAVTIPSLALGGATAWHVGQNYRRAFEERLADIARALGLAIDAEIGAHIAALRALVASPDLDADGDFSAFRRLAEPALAQFGSWVVVTDVAGRTQLANTALPPGAVLPRWEGPRAPMVERAVATGMPVVVNLHRGPATNRLVPAVVVPVVRSGQVVRLLAAPVSPERLSNILAVQGDTAGVFATLVDGLGLVVARSADHERHLGSPVPDWFEPLIVGRERGLVVGAALDGRDALIAFQRLGLAPSWTLSVGAPWDTYKASWLQPLVFMVAGGAATFAFALGLSAWLAARMLRPLRALVGHAESLATTGDVSLHMPEVDPTPVAEFEALRLATNRAGVALRYAATELRESEERFRLVAESAPVMLWMGDSIGKCIYLNRALRRFWGIAEDDFAGFDWSTMLCPEDKAALFERFGQAMQARNDFNVEARYYNAAGAIRVLSTQALPRFAADGAFLGMIGVNADVTDARQAEAALRDSEERLRLALEAAQLGSWEINLRTGKASRSIRTVEIFGFAADAQIGAYPSWRDRIHEDDRTRVAQEIEAVRDGTAERYRVEYRFQRPDGAWRWVESYGQAAERNPTTGAAWRLIGTTQDITERKAAEQRQTLLAREVDHRAKNVLAVVQAAVRLTKAPDLPAYIRAIEGRVGALARAQTLLAEDRWAGADLRTLLQSEFIPFLSNGGANGPRVDLNGPTISLPAGAAQPLAMAMHELATNATKHGALSTQTGRILISWKLKADQSESLSLRWAETGGPSVVKVPERRGFGSRVLDGTVRGQLGGKVLLAWETTGLVCDIEFPLKGVAEAGAAGADQALSLKVEQQCEVVPIGRAVGRPG